MYGTTRTAEFLFRAMMLFRVGASAAGFGVRGGAFSHPIAFGVQQHILCSRSSRRYFGRKSYILRCSAGGTGADTTSEAAEPRTIGSSPTRLGASVEYRPYKTLVPAAERLVVVGDVHGDIGASKAHDIYCTDNVVSHIYS